MPFAVVDPRGEPDPSVTTVGATNWSGGFTATRHLIELGHRRIGVISGPSDLLCSRARMDGYRSAMEAAGLPLDPELMQWGDFHVDGGFNEAMAMLARPEPPTAIFAGSDIQALGVLEAARVQHVRVPNQLSLIGFDDLPLFALDFTPAHYRSPTVGGNGRHRRPPRASSGHGRSGGGAQHRARHQPGDSRNDGPLPVISAAGTAELVTIR